MKRTLRVKSNMSNNGNAWLLLNKEEALEPELPICDPHHHLWDRREARYPYQRYLLDELLEDIGSGHNIRSTVFIEAESMWRASGPEEMKPIGEVEFIQGNAAASASGIYGECRIAAGIVGSANLNLGDGVRPVLEALKAASPNRFRGIRHRVTWDPHPEVTAFSPHGEQGQMTGAKFRQGARILADMGMSWEGWMFHHQLPELADFAKSVPELTIILNHIGGLLRIGPYASSDNEVVQSWKDGIAKVAECPNVVVKLGGMGMPIMGFDWHKRDKPIGSVELSKHMTPFIEYCIEQFGTERCMFESNFPVDKISFSYSVMYNAFKRLTKNYTQNERAAMFHDNAVRIYALNIE